MAPLNLDGDQPKLPPLWPSVGGNGGAHVLHFSPYSTRVDICCEHHLEILYGKKILNLRKFFFMLQCLFDQPLCKTLTQFSRNWLFLRSGLPWIIWRQRYDLISNRLQWSIEKTLQIIWDTLQDYGRIEGKWTPRDLEKAVDVAYHDILNNFDLIWGVKGLIVTQSSLIILWKDRPLMSIICCFPLGLRCFGLVGCILGSLCNKIFNLCQKKKSSSTWLIFYTTFE